MRPLAIDTLENPAPSPLATKSGGGPPAGHDCSNPVSVDTPSRCGPRHCGQKPPAAAACVGVDVDGELSAARLRSAKQTIERDMSPSYSDIKRRAGDGSC